jgi:iron complex transport system substrate-binding protein
MRVVSLLPSLTELVCALGRGGELVGATHECDYPPGVEALPPLTRSRIPSAAASAEIDALVAEQQGSLYELDEALLAELRPDLILTQEQCDVCAVNEATVRRAAARLPGDPHVESINPLDLGGVFEVFRRVGALLDAEAAADALISGFQATTDEIARRVAPSAKPPRRVLLLEWLDPPYCSGHWNPEIVARAGGVEVIGKAGKRSRRITWESITSAAPDVILLSFCGFTLDRADRELESFRDRPEWQSFTRGRENHVALVDGSAFFSRPGPRLETSLRIAAAAIHPENCHDLAPPEGEGWRRLHS